MENSIKAEFPRTRKENEVEHENGASIDWSKMPAEKAFERVLHGPEKIYLPLYFSKWAAHIKSMAVLQDDIWVITFPKSGTTWMQEMVWLLANDLNFEKAKEIALHNRFAYLEFGAILKAGNNWNPLALPNSLDQVSKMTSPRLIKSHLPLSLLPTELVEKHPKIIFVSRNPKDVCVSYFHHHVTFRNYEETLETFSETFLADRVLYAPYWEQEKGFHELRRSKHPNFLWVTYEQMKKDLGLVIKTVAKFLDKELTLEELEKLTKHLSFEEMKKNSAVNYDDLIEALPPKINGQARSRFIRKGQVGGWKEEMSSEIVNKFDEWIKSHQDEFNSPVTP